MSLAHELSGLGSTRVVRFSVSARRRIDEPDDVATGSQDEKIQGCVEPMGEEGTVGIGGERVAGDFRSGSSAVTGTVTRKRDLLAWLTSGLAKLRSGGCRWTRSPGA